MLELRPGSGRVPACCLPSHTLRAPPRCLCARHAPSPPPRARAPQGARPRCPRGDAPHRLLSFQPRWRRMAMVWAPSRSMNGSCRRLRAPIPPAWGPPSGKAPIPLGPRTAAAGRSSGAGRGVRHRPRAERTDRWCARLRAGAFRVGGPRPGPDLGRTRAGRGGTGDCTCRCGRPQPRELSSRGRWVWPPRRL